MHVAAEALEAGDLRHLGADRLRGDGARRAALEAGLEVGADLELALDEVGGLDRALERLQADPDAATEEFRRMLEFAQASERGLARGARG